MKSSTSDRGTVSIMVEDLGSSPPSLKEYTDNYRQLIDKSFDLKETKSTTWVWSKTVDRSGGPPSRRIPPNPP